MIIRIPIPVQQPVGAGTALASLLGRIGIRPCGGCERRKQWLDRWIVLQTTRKRS